MTKARDVRSTDGICNITPLLRSQVSQTCGQLVFHVMDYFGHRQFLPIALANESSDCCGSTRNTYGLVLLVMGWSMSIGLYHDNPGPSSKTAGCSCRACSLPPLMNEKMMKYDNIRKHRTTALYKLDGKIKSLRKKQHTCTGMTVRARV